MLAAVAAPAVSAAPAGAYSQAPKPGAVGIGDPLFPTLGNGGYDAQHYNMSLRYATADPAADREGHVTMFARSTQALSRFNLDFAGDSVKSVSVDGRRAASRGIRRSSRKFIRQLPKGSRVMVGSPADRQFAGETKVHERLGKGRERFAAAERFPEFKSI